MANHDDYAPAGDIAETRENSVGQTWLTQEIAARHALFDDAETAMRDEDDLPVERGASGANLRWLPVLDDEKLDRQARRAAWRLQKKHPHSDLDAEEVAQRIRQRLDKGCARYKVIKALPPEAILRFGHDPDWTKYAQAIIRNECARHADRMERECQARLRLISRDSHGETDADGDEAHWRENLDFRAALDEFDRDELRMAIEAAIAGLSGRSRQLIEAFYRAGLGQRTLAKALGMALSTFQNGPWKQMKADFKRNFNLFQVR